MAKSGKGDSKGRGENSGQGADLGPAVKPPPMISAGSGEAEVYLGHSIWYNAPAGEYLCGALNLYRFKSLEGPEGIRAAIDGIRMKTTHMMGKGLSAEFFEPNAR